MLLTCLVIFGSVILALLVLGTASITFTRNASGGLVSASSSTIETGEGIVYAAPDVLVAKSGVLTVRTSGTVGSLTMESGHGIITGQRFDMYWDGGQCYGCVAGTVSGLVVPIASTAGGTAFPVAATAVTIGIINTAVFKATGDNLTGLVLTTGVAGYIVIADGSGDLLANYLAAGGAYIWNVTSGITNPLAGASPTKVYMSQKGITATATNMQAQALTN